MGHPSPSAMHAEEGRRDPRTQEGMLLSSASAATNRIVPSRAPATTGDGGEAAADDIAAADPASSLAAVHAGANHPDNAPPPPQRAGPEGKRAPDGDPSRGPDEAANSGEGQPAPPPPPPPSAAVEQFAGPPATTAAAAAVAAAAAAAAAAAHADLGASADRPNDDDAEAAAAVASTAAAAEAPRRTAGSRECGNDRCVACSKLLQHCTASNVSLEERLQQILLCRRVVAADDPSGKDAATAASPIRVNATHAPRYAMIQEAVAHRDKHDNQRHRDAVKGLLGLLKIDKRQQLSQWTGVPLETVHLVPKKKVQSNLHESPSASRDNPNIMTGAAQAERQAHGTLDQQWRDETQKVVGRYLAQKARDEQASREEETTTERTEPNSTGVNHDATPRWLREGHLGDESETRRAPRAADPSWTSDRPNDAAGGPIQKRKDPNRERAIALKRAKTAAAVLPPKPRTELQRLEKETREAHERSLPSGHEDIKVRSFALEYNEWSVLAVAKWVNNLPTPSHGDLDDNNNHGAPPPLEIPTSPTPLRKCNVCTKFGHFDVLCPRLPPATSRALRADMDALIATWEESDDPAERVTELCEGYAIEQRDHAFDTLDDGDDAITTTQGPQMRRLPTQVRVTELDRMVIQAAPTADLLLDFA